MNIKNQKDLNFMSMYNTLPHFSQAQNAKKFLTFLNSTFSKAEARFIRDIIYNTQKKHGLVSQGKRWIYNTAINLGLKYGCTSRTIERLTKKLREQGWIIVSHVYPIRSVRTNCFRVDEAKLMMVFAQWCKDQYLKRGQFFAKLSTAFSSQKDQNVGIKASPICSTNKSILAGGFFSKKKDQNGLQAFKHNPDHPVFDCEWMLREWNNGFAKPLGFESQVMSKGVARALNAALKFGILTRKTWSDLVDALGRNEWFLKTAREKGWRITLRQILRFKTLTRMLKGGYGIGFVERSFGLPDDVKVKVEEQKKQPFKKKIAEPVYLTPRTFENNIPHQETFERDKELLDLANQPGGWAAYMKKHWSKPPAPQPEPEKAQSRFTTVESMLDDMDEQDERRKEEAHAEFMRMKEEKMKEVAQKLQKPEIVQDRATSSPAPLPDRVPRIKSTQMDLMAQLFREKKLAVDNASVDPLIDKESKIEMWRKKLAGL